MAPEVHPRESGGNPMMRTRIGVLAVAMSVGFAGVASLGCSRGASRYPLVSSPNTPAAQGSYQVKSEPNGNTRLAIQVRYLAPPARITSTATTYVAWIVPTTAAAGEPAPTGPGEPLDDQRPINVGAIEVGDDLEGKLETTTPFRKFDIMITPEPSPVALRPTNTPVLTARVENI
jgi:hypothetical protein